jgi:peptidyl-prolyl cis-trans isomerase C
MTETVATVNGSPIDKKALTAAMQSLAQDHFHATLAEIPAGSHAELRAMALERLLARELMFQAALAEGFVADDAAVEEETTRILRMMGNPSNFWTRLAERGMDQTSFVRMVRKDVTVDLISARKLKEVAEPNDEDIRQFYFAYPEKLSDKERVRASHILIPFDPNAPEAALELAKTLKTNAEKDGFAEIARLHSVCASAPGGGDLGYIRREDVDPSFAEAAFNQIVGVVGDPVRTVFGYHLILVTAHEIPSPPTLEEARGKIVSFLKRAQGAELLQQWVAELRRNAHIVISES